jgi:hypothetical protein
MFNSTNHTGTEAFAQFICDHKSAALAEFLIDNGLFNVTIDKEIDVARQFFDMSMGAWIAFTIDTERLMTNKSDFMDDFFLDVTHHVLYGTDTEEVESVGGFSQREIDLITDWIIANAH